MRARTRAGARGYTAVEVLISMTLLAIGTAGVISMQRASIEGNVSARRLDSANSLAHLWIERLRSDAMLWTLPNKTQTTDNRVSAAKLLATVDGAWHGAPLAYQNATPRMTRLFDALGHDLPMTALGASAHEDVFCVQTRLTWLVGGDNVHANDLIRADVRVIWVRDGITPSPKWTDACVDNPPSTVDTATDSYHIVYATTAIRRNEFYTP